MKLAIGMVLFLTFFLAILFGAHALVYGTLLHFFGVTQASTKMALASVLAFLAVSFFLTSLLAHLYENIVTRTFYFLAGFWLGLLVNLVLACLALWLISFLGHWAAVLPEKSVLGVVFFGAAFLVSLYGVWHALHPVVKHITVEIPGLPEQWKGQTIVQLTDVHLGHVYQAAFLRQVVEQVNTLHPRMVVITGDLFDGMDGRLDTLVEPLNSLSAEEGTYFVTGNHETYLGLDKTFAALSRIKMTTLHDEVRDIDGLSLIGIDYPKRGETKDPITLLQKLRPQYLGKPNILLYHAPVHIPEIAQNGINLMLSGHTHQGQQFPFQYITHLVHHGYDYGLFPIGNFTLYTSSGVGTWGPTMRIGTQSEIVAITLG